MKPKRSGTKKGGLVSPPIRSLGEQKLIAKLLKGAAPDPRNLSGIGDDGAVWRPSPGRDLLVSVDTLVEGVDFKFHFSPNARFIGHKALASNLSDIAAMGGRPRAFVVSLAAPGSTPLRRLTEIYSGIHSLARRTGVKLIGGDISASPRNLMLTITIFGEVAKNKGITRKGARPGDILFVSGSLGDSRAGLEILTHRGKNRFRTRSLTDFLVKRHLFPIPRVELGKWLSEKKWASAMIDISDGFASDIRHLCEKSGVGVRFAPEKFPVSRALREYCRIKRRNPAVYSVAGGEDFELLFSIPNSRCGVFRAAARRKGVRVYPIGKIVQRKEGIFGINSRNQPVPLTAKGFEHFSK